MQQEQQPLEPVPIEPLSMLLLGLVIGLIGGYGAVLFRFAISLFHNLLFYGTLSLHYDANVHADPSTWGWGFVFVPACGIVLVTWILRRFAPEAKGHGVPEVIDAIYYKEGKIRPSVGFFKTLASALSIGSGASVGREGPIIQIGAAFGSAVGQWVAMPTRQRITLIAAGAGAGIAATFNAPIGGVAFAIELLLVSVNAATVSVVLVATITAAFIGRHNLGLFPAFDIPELAEADGGTTRLLELVLFIPFGVVVGLIATFFIRLIGQVEDFFAASNINIYARNFCGMLLLGIVYHYMMEFTGHYYLQGVGYATIVDVLAGLLLNPLFLLFLVAAKMFATSLTLGSGSSGGVFSPSLFIGACLGAAFGKVMSMLLPHLGINPVMFAVAGMGGMISATTGAVLTAICMMFEMTRDYNAILPIMLTVGVAYFTRTLLQSDSINTVKLLRSGRVVHEGLQAAMKTAQTARNIMNCHFTLVSQAEFLAESEIYTQMRRPDEAIIIVADYEIRGLLREGASDLTVRSALATRYVLVEPEINLVALTRLLKSNRCEYALVTRTMDDVDPRQIIGVIGPHELLQYEYHVADLVNENY